MINIIYKTGITSNNSILDVGCGSGELLYLLNQAGFKKTHGIDPFIRKNINYNNGLTIKKQEFANMTGTWDLIMFNHSLEHMPNQVAVLKKVYSLLSPQGTCLVRIPNADSLAWKKYREHWMQIDAPRHCYLHTPKSFRLLATQAQLSIREIIYDSTELQFWGSEQYSQGITLFAQNSYLVHPIASPFKPNDIKRFIRQAHQANRDSTGDQIAIILERAF